MYGRIHYENETGKFRVLDCPNRATYERELNIACKWIEAEPRRPLGMWGERFIQGVTDELQPAPSCWDLRASNERTTPLDSETTSIQPQGGTK